MTVASLVLTQKDLELVAVTIASLVLTQKDLELVAVNVASLVLPVTRVRQHHSVVLESAQPHRLDTGNNNKHTMTSQCTAADPGGTCS